MTQEKSQSSSDERLKRYRKALLGRRAPLAWVDLDLLEENARDIAQRLGQKKLRVGTKSVRCRSVLDLILKWNPSNEGCMVLSAAEAVWLASLGYKNLVVGYPSVNVDEIKDVSLRIRAEPRSPSWLIDTNISISTKDSLRKLAFISMSGSTSTRRHRFQVSTSVFIVHRSLLLKP